MVGGHGRRGGPAGVEGRRKRRAGGQAGAEGGQAWRARGMEEESGSAAAGMQDLRGVEEVMDLGV